MRYEGRAIRYGIRCLPESGLSGAFKQRLRWFCGRNQMDIEEIGEKLVEQLVDNGIVDTFADLYNLTREQLLELERMGEKSCAERAGCHRPFEDAGIG